MRIRWAQATLAAPLTPRLGSLGLSELTWSNLPLVLQSRLGCCRPSRKRRRLQLGVQSFLLPASPSQGLTLLKQQKQERWGRNAWAHGQSSEILASLCCPRDNSLGIIGSARGLEYPSVSLGLVGGQVMRPLPIWSFGSTCIASNYVSSSTPVNQLTVSELERAESEGLGLKENLIFNPKMYSHEIWAHDLVCQVW